MQVKVRIITQDLFLYAVPFFGQMEHPMTNDEITFSFGENWQDFVGTVSEAEILSARSDIEEWLGGSFVSGKRIVDIGSGSGIHSYCFYLLDAASLVSFDYDPKSVEATKSFRRKAEEPENWRVCHGSILDKDFLQSIGQFDVVYSWGVLHHTGSMWEAIENSFKLVAPDGKIWISLYAKGPRYLSDLALKKKYNAAGSLGKKLMVWRWIARLMLSRLRHFKNPLGWNRKVGRGMNVYNDIIDWLGGLPYEVASEDEVVTFAREHNFVLEKIKVAPEGGCSKYVFVRAQY